MIRILSKLFKVRHPKRVAVCVYVCDADEHLLPAFYASPVMQYLLADAIFEVFEVFADSELTEPVLLGRRLSVNTRDAYENLPQKTFRMIRFFLSHGYYSHILKIDVTSLTRGMDAGLKTGGKALTEAEFLRVLKLPDFLSRYNGYARVKARRPGAENWAKNKGINIDYERVFASDELPPFFSGKMWLIDRQFATYFVEQAEDDVLLFTRFFPAEDVMLGYVFAKFQEMQA